MKKTSKIMSAATLAVMCMSVSMGTAMAVQPQQATAVDAVTMAATATKAQLKVALDKAISAKNAAIVKEKVAEQNLLVARKKLVDIDAKIQTATKMLGDLEASVAAQEDVAQKAALDVAAAEKAVEQSENKQKALEAQKTKFDTQTVTDKANVDKAKTVKEKYATNFVNIVKYKENFESRYKAALNDYKANPTQANLTKAANHKIALDGIIVRVNALRLAKVNSEKAFVDATAQVDKTKKQIADHQLLCVKASDEVKNAVANVKAKQVIRNKAFEVLVAKTNVVNVAKKNKSTVAALRAAAKDELTKAAASLTAARVETAKTTREVVLAQVRYDAA